MNKQKTVSSIARRVFAAALFIVCSGAASVRAQTIFDFGEKRGDTAALYRLFDERTGDHLYTPTCREKNRLAREGSYKYEGVAAYVATSERRGSVPLYRLQLDGGKHFYTTDQTEANTLAQTAGNRLEGIIGYLASQQQRSTVPLYRLFDSKKHFYTTSETEKDDFLRDSNSRLEGIIGYTWTTGTDACGDNNNGGSVSNRVPMIYADPNFQGASESIERDWEGNPNKIRSIRVPAGWYVVVYDRKNFRGRSLNVTADWSPTENDIWYGRVRSIQVFQGRPPRQTR